MNKIKLKLTLRELDKLIHYLELSLSFKPQDHIEKLVDVCLADLLHKLKLAHVMVKAEYKIQVPLPSAMALVVQYLTIQTKDNTIRSIVGQIDQKTV